MLYTALHHTPTLRDQTAALPCANATLIPEVL